MPSSNIQYAPYIEKFEDSYEFSYLATYFNEHKCYTLIPEETEEFDKFWEDIYYKCLEGFTNSKGIFITGPHFFYLNFIQILGKDPKSNRKKKIFPRFLDVDYDYFHIVDYAKKHQKNVILVKPRRLGFSYKAAALATHEFTFYRDSKSVIGAYLSGYAQTTMNMVIDNLNFLNGYTEFRKQRSPDTSVFIKARYQETTGGIVRWKGYQSECKMITFKDNEHASVGLTANWFLFDECGIFSNIIESYNMSEPTIKDGSDFTGTALMFGSAGSMEGGSQYFYEMFISPEKYNALTFPDLDAPGKLTGWFVKSTRGRLGTSVNGNPMVDKDGNSDEVEAYLDIMHTRDTKRGGLSSVALHDNITQYPLSYKEAFLRSGGSVFPLRELQEWLGEIETNKKVYEAGRVGELYFDENTSKIKFRLNQDLPYIMDFPIKSEQSKTGAFCIWEEPERINGDIPPFLYIAGCDPYDQDNASSTTSLGSVFVYKRFLTLDKTHDIIVAEYTGRPDTANDFYENTRKLCLYFNAKMLYENNLKGIKAYFEQKNCMHLMYETPSLLKDIVRDSRVSRGYGIHMNAQIKSQCELYMKDWLLEEREDLDGKKKLNVHTILSVPLLRELIAYDPIEGNFDRVIAAMLCILQAKEIYKIQLQHYIKKFEPDPFWNKPFFKKKSSFNNQY